MWPGAMGGQWIYVDPLRWVWDLYNTMEPTYPAMNPSAMHPDSMTVSEIVADTLRRTKGWVRFLSILGFIGCGFMIIAGLFMIFGGMAGMMGSSGSRGAMMGTAPLALMGGGLYLRSSKRSHADYGKKA